jgi:hypothetical protein
MLLVIYWNQFCLEKLLKIQFGCESVIIEKKLILTEVVYNDLYPANKYAKQKLK